MWLKYSTFYLPLIPFKMSYGSIFCYTPFTKCMLNNPSIYSVVITLRTIAISSGKKQGRGHK